MRIAIDSRILQGSRRGMGGYLHGLLCQVDRLGRARDLILLTEHGLPPLPGDLASRFACKTLRGGGGVVAWEQLHLPFAAREFDLLHCPANGAPLFCSRPVVVTMHDAIFVRRLRDISDSIYPRQAAGHFYRKYLYPVAARKAGAILTVSETSKRALVERMGVSPEKVTVTGEGIPEGFRNAVPEAIDALRVRYGMPGKYLLALGAYEKRKNIPLLFRMMELLASGPASGLKLVLAGAENIAATRWRETVENMGLASRVVFLPYLNDSELKGFYSGAAAFLFPSRSEGFGLPMIEAMDCGVPVLASDAAYSRETAGDAALLLDPDEPREWAAAIVRMEDDGKLRERLIREGRSRADSLDWSVTAIRTLEAYERVLATKKGSGIPGRVIP